MHTSLQTNFSTTKNAKSVLTQIYINKKKHANIKHKIFKELAPSSIALLEKHIGPGHAGIVGHSVDLSIQDF